MRQLIRTLNRLNPFRQRLTPRSPWQRLLPLGLSLGLPSLVRGENHVDSRYGYYQEDNDRMKIETFAIDFEQKIVDKVIAKGELVYDGVSGATPIGTHNWVDNGQGGNKVDAIKKSTIWDLRRAVNLSVDWQVGNHAITPGFAYSSEHDYTSYGISLNDAIDFNEKNTTLKLGVSHNFDSVRDSGRVNWHDKSSTEATVGVSQLLSPNDILDVAATFGNDSGYLSDPYRRAEYFDPFFGFGVPIDEVRPSHRNKEILFTSLTHYFDQVNASIEANYRFYHDSYDVYSQTVGVTWHQRLGKRWIVEPFARFDYQTAASFYSTLFYDPTPAFHSSDYRLSEFYSTDLGLQVTYIVCEHFHVTAGFHRYEMHGLDNVTSAEMYPKANVVSAGVSFLW